MQITRNEFACKLQGTFMGQKVTTRFWWECGLSSHPETISLLSADLLSIMHV